MVRAVEDDEPALWSEALAAVERAEGLLAQGGEADQKREANELKASIVADRDEARKESEWLAQLASIRSTKADSIDGSATESGYAQVFSEAGVDPDVLSAEQAGTRIRSRKPVLALALASALDDWAAVRRGQRNDIPASRRLLMVARTADPDAWRNRLRRWLTRPMGRTG